MWPSGRTRICAARRPGRGRAAGGRYRPCIVERPGSARRLRRCRSRARRAVRPAHPAPACPRRGRPGAQQVVPGCRRGHPAQRGGGAVEADRGVGQPVTGRGAAGPRPGVGDRRAGAVVDGQLGTVRKPAARAAGRRAARRASHGATRVRAIRWIRRVDVAILKARSVRRSTSRHGLPLGLVGVEQGGSAVPPATSASFQPRFHGVLDAGVHALAAGRAVDVGGVAGEEHPPGPVGRGVPVLQPEVGRPHRVVQHGRIARRRRRPGPEARQGRVPRAVAGTGVERPADEPPRGGLGEREEEGACPRRRGRRGRRPAPGRRRRSRPGRRSAGRRRRRSRCPRARTVLWAPSQPTT